MSSILYNNKEIWITTHAIKRARKRKIAFPDQVYDAILTGKVSSVKPLSNSSKKARTNPLFVLERI